jgi:hypothetical protein
MAACMYIGQDKLASLALGRRPNTCHDAKVSCLCKLLFSTTTRANAQILSRKLFESMAAVVFLFLSGYVLKYEKKTVLHHRAIRTHYHGFIVLCSDHRRAVKQFCSNWISNLLVLALKKFKFKIRLNYLVR